MGKGSSGSSHTPVEVKDTGRSLQILRILEVISEGEIHGLVDDMCSVYLDKTAVQNKDGSFNFTNISMYGASGVQDQDVLKEFGASENEISVGTQVRKNKPIVRTITDSNITRLRLTLGVKSLMRQSDNGDINGTFVTFNIQVGSTNYTKTISGKYSSAYYEMMIISGLPPVPFKVTVSRVEPDSTSTKLSNDTYWSAYTEIVDSKFAYPNTALMGIKIDGDYFSNQPQRNYEIYGIKVQVPDNYDPFTRKYTGTVWSGNFKTAWTNNPAWIFYDLCTNKRYGMGKRLKDFGVDKWQLYAIAKYCDELVPDGFGGTEPRMTCNVWLTEQKQAYELLNSLTSVFRAMPVWNGQSLTAIQDRVADPVWTYTNANVKDGKFDRTYSALKSRHNEIHVEYLDSDDFYDTKTELVSDDDSIRKYERNISKITAFGCTSRGQAYRTGRWVLETERLETETITFTVGREGLFHLPYDIIQVADSQYAGTEIGGRVKSVSGTKITLDRPITVTIDDASYLSVTNNKAQVESVKIVSYDAKTNTVTLAKAVTTREYAMWVLATKTISYGLYRAMAIKENDDGTYTITALQHVPEKEDIVTNGTHFNSKRQTIYSSIDSIDTEYNGKTFRVSAKVVNGSAEGGNQAVSYTIKILKDGVVVSIEKGLSTPDFKIDDLENGSYEVVIYAYNKRGQLLSQQSKSFVIDRPPVVTGIDVVGHLSSIILTWDWIDDITDTEIWVSTTNDLTKATLVERIKGRYYQHSVGAVQTRYYWLRHVRGVNYGAFDRQQGRKGVSSKDIDKELQLLNEKLSENIIEQVFDTALPARNLELTKTVDDLATKSPNLTKNIGYKQVYDVKTGKVYVWNGTKYDAGATEILASAIKGIIQPSQLALIPTTKLSGQITDAQLSMISSNKINGTLAVTQMPSIPTTKLTGTISESQISANSIGANAIRVGVIGTQHLGANSVNANAIQANSIGVNALQSNAVNADKIQSNAITSGKISAGAIRTDHLSAGQITADKLAIGLGGNLLQNPIFANVINDRPHNWNHTVYNSNLTPLTIQTGHHEWLSEQVYYDNENVAVYRIDTSNSSISNGSKVMWFGQTSVPIVAGKTYMFSAYVATHRMDARLYVDIRSPTDAYKGTWTSNVSIGTMQKSLEHASRIFVKFTAPSNTNKVDLYIMCYKSTQSRDAVLFVMRPMLEECTEYTTAPSAWQNAGVTSIHGGSIVTNSITAKQIQANTITANEIAVGTITARQIASETITGDKIKGTTIEANKLKVSTLSAITANLGSITAGSIKIGSLSGAYGTYFELQSTGGFRLLSRDGSGGIELSSSKRALTVWEGTTERVKVGKLS